MAKAPSRKQAGGPATLVDTLEQRVEELRGLARKALGSWDSEAIHHSRVATRRLSAATDLLQPLLPDEPRRAFEKPLRKLRRALGPLRDLDVMLLHLGEMKIPGSQRLGAAWVNDRLLERRGELRRESARKLSPAKAVSRLAAWVDLEPEVRAAEAAAGALLARTIPEQVRALAACADELVRSSPEQPGAAAAVAPARGPCTTDAHELRVAAKLLRYTLETAASLGVDVPASAAKEFKKLQDALGLWHDYVVLTNETLRLAIDSDLAAHHPDVFSEVLELARVCWGRSEKYLAQFRRLWAERGASLAERVAGAFVPGGEAPARSKAPDDGPNGSPSEEARMG